MATLTENVEDAAIAVGRSLCVAFPLLCPAVVAGGVGGVAGVAAAEAAAQQQRALEEGASTWVDELGENATDVIGATAAPLANVAETTRWFTIGIIAIAVVVLALIALFVFLYLRHWPL